MLVQKPGAQFRTPNHNLPPSHGAGCFLVSIKLSVELTFLLPCGCGNQQHGIELMVSSWWGQPSQAFFKTIRLGVLCSLTFSVLLDNSVVANVLRKPQPWYVVDLFLCIFYIPSVQYQDTQQDGSAATRTKCPGLTEQERHVPTTQLCPLPYPLQQQTNSSQD